MGFLASSAHQARRVYQHRIPHRLCSAYAVGSALTVCSPLCPVGLFHPTALLRFQSRSDESLTTEVVLDRHIRSSLPWFPVLAQGPAEAAPWTGKHPPLPRRRQSRGSDGATGCKLPYAKTRKRAQDWLRDGLGSPSEDRAHPGLGQHELSKSEIGRAHV